MQATASAVHEECLPLRRAAIVLILVAALGMADCGRQVTPDPTSFTNLSGKMVIRFRTKGPMDFNNFNYVMVFNTCGVGGEPYPNAFNTTFTNYSYAFAIGATYGIAGAALFQYVLAPGSSNQLNPLPVSNGAGTTQLVLNDNNANNEFQLTFARGLLNNPLNQKVCQNTPAGTPTNLWYINFFTLDKNGIVQDSLGVGGPNDNSFSFNIDVTTNSQNPLFRPAGPALPSNPAAQIDGGEIDTFL
ncbi:MAG: hypothetical protein GIW95_09560 [Candidatus Eremiobacteraeota bacterium]|nr:hypothetical protein [Candidatus Eremiobacteraeota bacterium]